MQLQTPITEETETIIKMQKNNQLKIMTYNSPQKHLYGACHFCYQI